MLAPDSLLQNRYLIVRLIAQGGMGAVYQATDQRLGNTVALKETFFNDEQMLKAFEREARLLAGLRHHALPKVSDHFTEGSGQFLVMEFITGNDLGELLAGRREPFPLSDVLRWCDHLLDALEFLHTQPLPIIHRDIKPQNLKLTARGEIILLDFGLAKGASTQVSSMTGGQSVFGYTAQYAPLEQIQGAGTDARSDLYSLAATIYHLITGAAPADALSRAAALVSGQQDPLRPANAINSKVPSSVAEVLLQAMALNRDQRPASAAQMRRTMAEASRSIPVENEPAPIVKQTQDIKKTPTVQNSPTVRTLPDRTPDTIPVQQQSNRPWLWVAFGGAGMLVIALIAVVALFVVMRVSTNRSANEEHSKPVPESSKPAPEPSQPSASSPMPTKIGPYEPSTAPVEQQPKSTAVNAVARAEDIVVRGETLRRDDLRGLTVNELKRLRNAVYARHGRTFKTPELQQYFDTRSWYRPRYDYSDTDLSATDQANIKLIQQAENE